MGDSSDAFDHMSDGFRGEILRPDDAGYAAARSVWNATIDRRPALIARCRGLADVMAAVRHARAQGLPVSIRGGAHNVAGHAVADDALMIDLSLMRAVHVDPARRIAVVEGGATWGDVDRETQAFGLATPGGLISDTGVGGLTLSGGIGWLRAKHGLAVDNLVAADVVTADGQLVRASETENPDLLWALRGGGGNFGVVVRFEFALHPVGPEVAFVAPMFALDDGAGPIRAWRDLVTKHADRVASLCEFSTVAESEAFAPHHWGKRGYTLACVWNGDPEEGERVLAPLRQHATPIADFSGRMSYCAVQTLFDTQIPFGALRCYWKARFLTDLPDEMIELAMSNAAHAPSARSISSLWNLGGATARVAPEATAFGDRSMGWMYSLDAVWAAPTDDDVNIAWSRTAWESAARYGHAGRVYLNFAGHGEDGAALTAAAFGPNYRRLVEIKTKYDSENVFRFNQNIAPAA